MTAAEQTVDHGVAWRMHQSVHEALDRLKDRYDGVSKKALVELAIKLMRSDISEHGLGSILEESRNLKFPGSPERFVNWMLSQEVRDILDEFSDYRRTHGVSRYYLIELAVMRLCGRAKDGGVGELMDRFK